MTEVEKLMNLLDCTEEEAKDIIKTDKEIDQGAKHFELSTDQKKAEKKMRSIGIKTVNPYGKQITREKPQDLEKMRLIGTMQSALKNLYDNNSNVCTDFVTINHEREFTFFVNGKKYKVVLSCPRSQSYCTKFDCEFCAIFFLKTP